MSIHRQDINEQNNSNVESSDELQPEIVDADASLTDDGLSNVDGSTPADDELKTVHEDEGLPLYAMLVRGVVGLVILIIGFALMQVMVFSAPVPEPAEVESQLPVVQVMQVQPVPVQRQWLGYGTVRALDSADIPARITATVLEIPQGIEVGVKVEANQVLLKLDPEDFERDVDVRKQTVAELQAQREQLDVEQRRLIERVALDEADAKLARDEFERVKTLVGRAAANQRDVDRAERESIAAQTRLVQTQESLDRIDPRIKQIEAQVAGQQAALKRAQLDLDRTVIRSPIAGVLSGKGVEVGEILTAGQMLGSVVDLNRVEVALDLAASSRSDIAIGDAVKLFATNGTEQTWSGKVNRISPVNSVERRTMTVFVEVNQSDALQRFGGNAGLGLLVPGQFVQGVVKGDQVQQRLVVPRRAVRGGRVFTLTEKNIVSSQAVASDFSIESVFDALGLPDDQWTVLEDGEASGLAIGQRVLVNASASVAEGETVQADLVN